MSETTWLCHLAAGYPPIWPQPEHINKIKGECLVSPISGFFTEDAPPTSKCENRATHMHAGKRPPRAQVKFVLKKLGTNNPFTSNVRVFSPKYGKSMKKAI